MSSGIGGAGVGSTSQGGSGGSFPAAGATEDTNPAGGTINLTANVATWNVGASGGVPGGTFTYQLPVDTKPVAHTVSWKAGIVIVAAPNGWHVVNPINGSMSGTTYQYGSGGNGVGESYGWVADTGNQLVWPIA